MPVEVHMPDQLGTSGVVKIDGEIACSICGIAIDQSNIEREEVIALTGKRAYVAHVLHFFAVNPVNGEYIEKPEYAESMKLFAMKYGIGEGLAQVGAG